MRHGDTLPHTPGGYNARHWRKRLHQSGDSLSVYLPHQLCRELGLERTSEVLVYLVKGCIVLQRPDEPAFVPLVTAADLGRKGDTRGDTAD